eukprot:TRINITY_DN26909_c0_g1_i1.p1 TRINITY_DN26909_c0_g1~~TRINITY_DN26909_c0_g1_i1.p1  ORF type:complete len:443 (+),score=121.91 TRINITY_DN26909_c0_g1_i1:57-1331(+)
MGADDEDRPVPLLAARRRVISLLAPSLVVMLADNDAPSLVTAAQTGKQWGFAFVLWQFMLVLPVYMVQDLAVRLGSGGRGFGEAVRMRYGRWCASAVGLLLCASCTATLASEFSALGDLAEDFSGRPVASAVALATAAVVFAAVATGTSVWLERCCLCLGLAEVVFLVSALVAPPSLSAFVRGVRTTDFGSSRFSYDAAANVGTSIMPWMVFYEQAAVARKRLTGEEVSVGRLGALLSVLFSQTIIAAVICASAMGGHGPAMSFRSIADVAMALSPRVGPPMLGLALSVCALVGAAMNAALVVSIAGADGVAETLGLSPRPGSERALWWRVGHGGMLLAAVLLSTHGRAAVRIDMAVLFSNALLMPAIDVLVLRMASSKEVVPCGSARLRGRAYWVYASCIGAAASVGVASAFAHAVGSGVGRV